MFSFMEIPFEIRFIMKFFLLLLSITILPSSYAYTIKANMWQKEFCPPHQTCFPEATSEVKTIHIPEPDFQSFSQTEAYFNHYRVLFTLAKRQDAGGYYSFQIEIQDLHDGQAFALCSRYEALETFEEKMVGSCAGRSTQYKGLTGIALTLP